MKRTSGSVFNGERILAFESLVSHLTPDKLKTIQDCQPHEITEPVQERLTNGHIQENCMNIKVPSKNANLSFEGVSPRWPESGRDKDEETQGIVLSKTPTKMAVMGKKHSPKVIQEGKPIKSPMPVTPETAENKERRFLKRTYVQLMKALNSSGTPSGITEENKEELIPIKTYVRRRKALNSPESPSGRIGETMASCSSTAVKTIDQLPGNVTQSVRRSLDFSSEGNVKSAYWETFNGIATLCSREFTEELTQGLKVKVAVTKSLEGVACDLNHSLNQVLDDSIKFLGNPTPSVQSSGTDIVRKHLRGSDCLDAENDLSMKSEQEQFSDSHSNSIIRNDDIEKSGTERGHDQIDVSQHCPAKESPIDIRCVHVCNETKQTSLCQEISGLSLFLPVVYTRRTQRGQIWGSNRALLTKFSRCSTYADAQRSAAFDRLQQSQLTQAFDPTQRVTRKRPKVPTPACKPTPIAGAEGCSHLLRSPERTKGSRVRPQNRKYGPQACMDAFADTRFKIPMKKHRNRKKGHVRLVSIKPMKKHRKKGHVQLASSMLLDMEKECEVSSSKLSLLGEPFVSQAVVPFVDPAESSFENMKHMKKSRYQIKPIDEAKNALIPYGGGSMMVTMKKQLPRSKVDLDQETNRVWNLLMGKKSNDEADGLDMDKEKWWEGERHLFCGRADAFIARMHLIQGDRRFSKWNGSVVDSAVGAFLTQNVSDHLSSSAFMSLAARFPLRSRDNSKETNAEKMNTTKEKMSILKAFAPGSTGVYKKERETTDVSSSLGSISYELSQVHDEQSVELQPEERNTDFPVEFYTHQEVEILTETHHCGEQKHLSSCSDLEETLETMKANLKNEARGIKNKKPETNKSASRAKEMNAKIEKEVFDGEGLRREAFANGAKNERSSETMDSLDWEAVRNADENEISKAIRERGMNNKLAKRIKDFLDRLVNDHGSIDLEWLRHVPPDKAKKYLLDIRGLGLKSVECVRLLTLHHIAFPVDTNVGRICVRLGWVPLQPLPESLQLHLLEQYPLIQNVQKYLWPRLCILDQQALYELHYQMITFGKVFCTKTKPNCNACPMRGECKHFASAFASAKLSLPGPETNSSVTSRIPSTLEVENSRDFMLVLLPQLEGRQLGEGTVHNDCQPIIEEPATPEYECTKTLESDIEDIEDAFYEDPEEIPTIKLNLKEFKKNLKKYMQENKTEIEDGDMSKALVAITADAASIPMPKLKNVSRLRTEHQVYELPDSHPLLEGMDQRVPGDQCPYLLAIWTPGETAQSIKPPQSCFKYQDSAKLCDGKTCFECNSMREAQAQIVRGTILIPCRTAMKGSFPLNGTYFQVNEVFADHSSSCVPIDVPRDLIWNLPRRTVFFGTSTSSIFKGLPVEVIQNCFWTGFVCVKGFDRASRAPKPLYARLHFHKVSRTGRHRKTPIKEEESGTSSNV